MRAAIYRVCIPIFTPRRYTPADCQSATQQAASLRYGHLARFGAALLPRESPHRCKMQDGYIYRWSPQLDLH